jgi:HD superfamily phosphohydrolase
MEQLNTEFDGALEVAMEIFRGTYPKAFLNQLVSSQLDMDRLDYLKRDSFYTGVAEGNINAERLITMLSVYRGNLVVEAKGIYSVEKFLMARRFMYWQVYLHKTGLAAEQLLIRVIRRARELLGEGRLECQSQALEYFLKRQVRDEAFPAGDLQLFAGLDDVDILAALKGWRTASDPVLGKLCDMILDRRLPTIKMTDEPVGEEVLARKVEKFCARTGMTPGEASYFVFDAEISNRAYNRQRQNILILERNGKTVDVAGRSDPLSLQTLSEPVTRFYICYPKKGV